MSYYVDVHCHLTHEKFSHDYKEVLKRAQAGGLEAMVVNGLEPVSNRKIIEMAKEDEMIKPALGIYPIDAVCDHLPEDFPFPVKVFDVESEIEFIRQKSQAQEIIAVGECGLDGHWLGAETYPKQEQVFSKLLEIAKENDIPAIIHSRKLEKRTLEMVESHGNKKIVFHCYGGKTKLALKAAHDFAWCFSIPAIAHKNQAFLKLLKELPPETILTETDSPYLSPEKNTRNEPSNVIQTIALLAEVRGWSLSEAKDLVCSNYKRLFCKPK